jgi:hypothetical protein
MLAGLHPMQSTADEHAQPRGQKKGKAHVINATHTELDLTFTQQLTACGPSVGCVGCRLHLLQVTPADKFNLLCQPHGNASSCQ